MQLDSPKKISSPQIGNNYILRNIKNAENIETHLETQQLQKSLSHIKKISWKEFARFIVFLVLFFIIVTRQIPVEQIQIQNQQIISQVLASTAQPDVLIDIRSQDVVSMFSLYTPLVISKIAKPYYYYVNSPVNGSVTLFSLNNTFTPVTNVRIRQKRAKTIANDSFIWVSPLTYDTSTYGPLNYKYDDFIDSFAVYPSFFTYNISKDWGYEDNLEEAGFQYGYYTYMKFFDEKTCQVNFDVTVLNTANGLLTYIEIQFDFSPTGLLTKSIFLTTFQFKIYEIENIDYIRTILEICYIIIFTYYLLLTLSEIYFEIKNVPVYESKYDENESKKLQILMRFLNFIKKLIKKVFFGTKNYLSNIWNFLDMMIISLGIFGLFQWLSLISNSSKFQLNLVDYTNLSDETIHTLNRMNSLFESDASKVKIYYFIVSKMVLVLSLKLLKYLITFSQKFSNLLRVLMNIFDTIIFFVILVLFCFIGFMYLYTYYIGSQYPIFEDMFSAAVFIFGLLIGASKRFKTEENENPSFTTFFYIFFSFIMVFILLNLFLVIVKNELTKLEQTRKIEKNKLNKLIDKFEYQPSIYWRLQQKIKSIYMNVLFVCNKNRYLMILNYDENIKRLIQNEISLNQNLNFDIDYQDIDLIYSNIIENEYTIEGEKDKYNTFFKKKLVKNIWFAFFLACILLINIYVFVVLFSSEKNYESTSSILQKIENSAGIFQNEKYTLANTESKLKSIIYLSEVIPSYFTKKFLYFPSNNDTNSTNDTNSNNANPNVYQFYNISSEFAINYLIGYNFLCENMVRLTVRKKLRKIDTSSYYFTKFNQTPMYSSFSYDSFSDINEEISSFDSILLERKINYEYDKSYGGLGGYTFFFPPDVNTTFLLINSLYEEKFLNDQMNSLVLDFVLVNPLSNNDMTYVKVIFQFDNAGNVIIEKNINTVTRNRMKTFNEKMVIGLFITIAIFFIIFTLVLFKNLTETLNGYESWFCLFIKNTLPEALIYHRERKKPEIIRKLKIVLTVKFIIECFFVMFNFFFYTFYVIFLVQVLSLEDILVLLGKPLESLDIFRIDEISFLNYQRDDAERLKTIFTKIENVILLKDLAALFASFTIFCLCFQLLFYLCKNSKFKQLLKAIFKSLKELPYILFLFIALILAFSFSAYLLQGQYRNNFKSILLSFTSLVQYLYRIEDMDFLMANSFLSMSLFFTIIIPYIFIVKFLILNLFLSIIFRAYENSKNIESESKAYEISMKDFFLITCKFFLPDENQSKDSKNFEIYMQTINKNNFNSVFDKFRESIESSNRNTSIHIWANICAEEIKNEQQARSQLKAKCDEISQEYFLNSFKGNISYFKEVNKNYERKLVEYQIRHKYWQYLYFGHVKLNSYYQYFLNKLNYLGSKLNMDHVISEKITEEIIEKKEDKITKVYIKDLETKLEGNLQDLRVLTQSHDKLLKIQEKFEEKLKEYDININRKSISKKTGIGGILRDSSHLKKSKINKD